MALGPTASIASAQMYRSARSIYTASTTQAVIGDRVDVSHTFIDKDGEPMKIDQKARFSIKNPKAGQRCETTDDSLTGDGKISGYCEATSEVGNMEVTVSTDTQYVSFEGETYSFWSSETKNIMFSSKDVACKDATTPPSNVQVLKQNDITVDVKWQHPESYIGTYDVQYGTTVGEYPNSKKTSTKNVVVDGLNSSKEYFFKIKATSVCGNVTYSSVYKYTPLTGATVVVSENTATTSPTPKPSPTVRPTPTPVATPTPSAQIVTQTKVASSPAPSPSTEPVSSDELPKTDSGGRLVPLALIAVGLLLPAAAGGGYLLVQARQKKLSSSTPRNGTPLG